MRNRLLTGLACLLLAGLAPLAAHADQVRTVRPGPDAAQISGSPALRNQDIFEVRFIEINGQNIPRREFMWLEPGTYRIRVAILAQHTRPPQRRLGPPADAPDHNVIELELEAGKTYQIRGRFNRDNPEQPYSVILHRVE
jgi:hypothetical protein